MTFCVFRPLEQVVFEQNYCFWIIPSIRWTYILTTVYSIAQSLIWSNEIFLTNCVKTAYFLISQCPYTFRMVEILSLYFLMVANNVKENFFLIWNGTSWNTENCWNFWSNCFDLWGISFWKRKNGSGTPCIFMLQL